MEITVNKNENTLTISPIGRIDTATAPELQTAVNENISGVTDLTFDLKQLQYISSAGLRVLMSTQKTMNQQGSMKLIHVNEEVMDVFDMPEKCRITQDILCRKKRLECSTAWCHARERHFARRRRDK